MLLYAGATAATAAIVYISKQIYKNQNTDDVFTFDICKVFVIPETEKWNKIKYGNALVQGGGGEGSGGHT